MAIGQAALRLKTDPCHVPGPHGVEGLTGMWARTKCSLKVVAGKVFSDSYVASSSSNLPTRPTHGLMLCLFKSILFRRWPLAPAWHHATAFYKMAELVRIDPSPCSTLILYATMLPWEQNYTNPVHKKLRNREQKPILKANILCLYVEALPTIYLTQSLRFQYWLAAFMVMIFILECNVIPK